MIAVIAIVVAIGAVTFPLWGPYVVDKNSEDRDER